MKKFQMNLFFIIICLNFIDFSHQDAIKSFKEVILEFNKTKKEISYDYSFEQDKLNFTVVREGNFHRKVSVSFCVKGKSNCQGPFMLDEKAIKCGLASIDDLNEIKFINQDKYEQSFKIKIIVYPINKQLKIKKEENFIIRRFDESEEFFSVKFDEDNRFLYIIQKKNEDCIEKITYDGNEINTEDKNCFRISSEEGKEKEIQIHPKEKCKNKDDEVEISLFLGVDYINPIELKNDTITTLKLLSLPGNENLVTYLYVNINDMNNKDEYFVNFLFNGNKDNYSIYLSGKIGGCIVQEEDDKPSIKDLIKILENTLTQQKDLSCLETKQNVGFMFYSKNEYSGQEDYDKFFAIMVQFKNLNHKLEPLEIKIASSIVKIKGIKSRDSEIKVLEKDKKKFYSVRRFDDNKDSSMIFNTIIHSNYPFYYSKMKKNYYEVNKLGKLEEKEVNLYMIKRNEKIYIFYPNNNYGQDVNYYIESFEDYETQKKYNYYNNEQISQYVLGKENKEPHENIFYIADYGKIEYNMIFLDNLIENNDCTLKINEDMGNERDDKINSILNEKYFKDIDGLIGYPKSKSHIVRINCENTNFINFYQINGKNAAENKDIYINNKNIYFIAKNTEKALSIINKDKNEGEIGFMVRNIGLDNIIFNYNNKEQIIKSKETFYSDFNKYYENISVSVRTNTSDSIIIITCSLKKAKEDYKLITEYSNDTAVGEPKEFLVVKYEKKIKDSTLHFVLSPVETYTYYLFKNKPEFILKPSIINYEIQKADDYEEFVHTFEYNFLGNNNDTFYLVLEPDTGDKARKYSFYLTNKTDDFPFPDEDDIPDTEDEDNSKNLNREYRKYFLCFTIPPIVLGILIVIILIFLHRKKNDGKIIGANSFEEDLTGQKEESETIDPILLKESV